MIGADALPPDWDMGGFLRDAARTLPGVLEDVTVSRVDADGTRSPNPETRNTKLLFSSLSLSSLELGDSNVCEPSIRARLGTTEPKSSDPGPESRALSGVWEDVTVSRVDADGTRNPKPESSDPKPETRNPEPETGRSTLPAVNLDTCGVFFLVAARTLPGVLGDVSVSRVDGTGTLRPATGYNTPRNPNPETRIPNPESRITKPLSNPFTKTCTTQAPRARLGGGGRLGTKRRARLGAGKRWRG